MNRDSAVSLTETLDQLYPLIEADLQELARVPDDSPAAYYGMMHYHLGWVDQTLLPVETNSGKRLRPAICLLACQAAGGEPRQALPAASALELVHNFSLVHDDIQDGSHLRRGRQAVWDLWGVAHGINVGDGLFVLARLALHRLSEQDVPLDRQLRATLALDRACLALCEGQYMDMTFEEQRSVNLEQYLWMIQHKTAALLAASAEIGAIVATDGEARSYAALVEHYRCFGENMGMAFQIQDDILGAWGDEQVTGKSTATDIRDKKKTLPVVYALNHPEDRQAAEELAGLYDSDEPLDEDGIRAALEILDKLGSRQYAEQVAETYHRRALDSLARCGPQASSLQPASSTAEELARRYLRELAASLMGRSV